MSEMLSAEKEKLNLSGLDIGIMTNLAMLKDRRGGERRGEGGGAEVDERREVERREDKERPSDRFMTKNLIERLSSDERIVTEGVNLKEVVAEIVEKWARDYALWDDAVVLGVAGGAVEDIKYRLEKFNK